MHKGSGRGRGWGGQSQGAEQSSAEDVRGWFAGRLPDGWFTASPEVTVDREEILVVGPLRVAPAADGPEVVERQRCIGTFREETRAAVERPPRRAVAPPSYDEGRRKSSQETREPLGRVAPRPPTGSCRRASPPGPLRMQSQHRATLRDRLPICLRGSELDTPVVAPLGVQ